MVELSMNIIPKNLNLREQPQAWLLLLLSVINCFDSKESCSPAINRCLSLSHWPMMLLSYVPQPASSPPGTRVQSASMVGQDRKSTRLNSSHTVISYAV